MGAKADIGVCIFIYSGSSRLVSFEIRLISKEINPTETEYMNIHSPPPINVLAPPLMGALPQLYLGTYAGHNM